MALYTPRAVRRRLRFFVRRADVFGTSVLLSQSLDRHSGRGRQLFIARGSYRNRHYRRRQRVYVDVSDPRYATWDDGLAAIHCTPDRLLVRFRPRCAIPWKEVEVELIGLDPEPLQRLLQRICAGRVPLIACDPAAGKVDAGRDGKRCGVYTRGSRPTTQAGL